MSKEVLPRPSGGLKDSSERLHYEEISHWVDIFGFRIAECVAEEARQQHAQWEEVAEWHSLSNHSGEEHRERIAKEEAGVEQAEQGRSIRSI